MLVDGFFHKNALMLDDKPTLLDTPHIQGFKIFSLNGAMLFCLKNFDFGVFSPNGTGCLRFLFHLVRAAPMSSTYLNPRAMLWRGGAMVRCSQLIVGTGAVRQKELRFKERRLTAGLCGNDLVELSIF